MKMLVFGQGFCTTACLPSQASINTQYVLKYSSQTNNVGYPSQPQTGVNTGHTCLISLNICAHPPANTCLTSCGLRMNCKIKAVRMYCMFSSKSNELKHHTRMLVMQNCINKMKLRQNNINNSLLAYPLCFTL